MTKMVMGIKASSTGTSMACKSAHRSITPAAAGTNSSGKMPVRNSAAVRTCSSLTTPKRSAASSSISPYTLAGMGSGSTRWQTSPAKQNAAMRANSNISFIYAFPFCPAVPPLPPCAKQDTLSLSFFCFPGLHRQPGSHFFMLHKYSRLPNRGQGQFLTCLTNIQVFFCIL